MAKKEKPYIIKKKVVVDRFYNPNYGDDRTCKCGHSYNRHFDSYENNAPVGCKYCECYIFEEETEKNVFHLDFAYTEITGEFKSIPEETTISMLKSAEGIVKTNGVIPSQEIFFRVEEFDQASPLKGFVGYKIRYKGELYNLES